MTPEGRVKAMVAKALATLPKVYKFMPVQQGLGASTLDYLCCVSGQFVAIETKAKGKLLTPRQTIVAAVIREAGGTVFVIDDRPSCDLMIAQLKLLTEFAL